MIQLSEHLTDTDFTVSTKAAELGINNDLPDELIGHASIFAENCFEVIRRIFGDQPLPLNSGYRCEAVNDAVNGSTTSQHMVANAMDFHVHGYALKDAFKVLLQSDLVYDQLFIEGANSSNPNAGWLHCSYNTHETHNGQNRMQVKIVTFPAGKPVYTLVSKDDALAWCEE
jgi:hypothetical protein